MDAILELIENRCSTRAPFDPNRPVSKADIKKIIEAGRWAPTAHNMQNFEVIVIDDKKVLGKMAQIKSKTSEAFIRENLQQLCFSEEELKKKKVGIMGSGFPPAWREASKLDQAVKDVRPSPLSYAIKDSQSILIILYDSRKRAPASEGDVLGFLSLGCVMENMWLMAQSLGIGFQIVSTFSNEPVAKELKKILDIPSYMVIGFSVRLGYPPQQGKYLRVRREIKDFTHLNKYGNKKF